MSRFYVSVCYSFTQPVNCSVRHLLSFDAFRLFSRINLRPRPAPSDEQRFSPSLQTISQQDIIFHVFFHSFLYRQGICHLEAQIQENPQQLTQASVGLLNAYIGHHRAEFLSEF
mmetsp:Transcript_24677/g.42504  ORF Transcript_24677/g.42504 Transcript_24677/m.42504 type:complete len:114 (+) Transcript_24677:364-705(+)